MWPTFFGPPSNFGGGTKYEPYFLCVWWPTSFFWQWPIWRGKTCRCDHILLTKKYLAGVRSVIFQTTNGWILAKHWVSNTSMTKSLWAHFANFSIQFGWYWLNLEKQTRFKIADGCCQQFSNVPVSTIKSGLPFVKWKSVSFCETKSGFKLHIFRFGET